MEAQKKVENKMTLTVVELKQTKKQLEAKEAEKSQAEQVAYDASMTKVAKSLTTQLRDVARAFCLEVWGQALNAGGLTPNQSFGLLIRYTTPLPCVWHPLPFSL